MDLQVEIFLQRQSDGFFECKRLVGGGGCRRLAEYGDEGEAGEDQGGAGGWAWHDGVSGKFGGEGDWD